jgi:hypothetical protein
VSSLIQLIIVAGAIVFFLWLLMGNSQSTGASTATGDELIDPNDTRQLATLVGMTGGDITDVAVARFAIQRFQEQNGRAPSTRDIATLLGIMHSL